MVSKMLNIVAPIAACAAFLHLQEVNPACEATRKGVEKATVRAINETADAACLAMGFTVRAAMVEAAHLVLVASARQAIFPAVEAAISLKLQISDTLKP